MPRKPRSHTTRVAASDMEQKWREREKKMAEEERQKEVVRKGAAARKRIEKVKREMERDEHRKKGAARKRIASLQRQIEIAERRKEAKKYLDDSSDRIPPLKMPPSLIRAKARYEVLNALIKKTDELADKNDMKPNEYRAFLRRKRRAQQAVVYRAKKRAEKRDTARRGREGQQQMIAHYNAAKKKR